MMQLTCFRGPWAYENLARVEAKKPRTAYEVGERVAALVVRLDESRRELLKRSAVR